MPITFEENDSLPDVLDASRFEIRFGAIPGGADGYQLGLRHGTGTFPAAAVAQVPVKFPGGHTRRFRGGSTTDGTWTLIFFDDSFVSKAFAKWAQFVRNSKTSKSKLKSEYAIDVEAVWSDTKGEDALVYTIKNIFPISVEKPNTSENSAAVQFTVTFSLDSMDLKEDQ